MPQNHCDIICAPHLGSGCGPVHLKHNQSFFFSFLKLNLEADSHTRQYCQSKSCDQRDHYGYYEHIQVRLLMGHAYQCQNSNGCSIIRKTVQTTGCYCCHSMKNLRCNARRQVGICPVLPVLLPVHPMQKRSFRREY